MTQLHTTFNLLKLKGACGQKRGSGEGYDKLAQYLGGVTKYGKNTPIPLSRIVESNGLADALWCLQAVSPEQEKERDAIARLFACDCAEHVLHYFEDNYPEDKRPRQAIEAARRLMAGAITSKELAAAGTTAWDAAWAASGDAARAAAWDADRQWQTERFEAYMTGEVLYAAKERDA